MNDEEPAIDWPPSFPGKSEKNSELAKNIFQQASVPLVCNSSQPSSFFSHENQRLPIVESLEFPIKGCSISKSPIYSDRFIPLKRKHEGFYPDGLFPPSLSNDQLVPDSSSKANYQNMLSNACLLSYSITKSFPYVATAPKEYQTDPFSIKKTKLKYLSFKKYRRLPDSSADEADFLPFPMSREIKPEGDTHEKQLPIKSPYKVIKTPCINDDFYLNLLHWSSNNYVAVALGENVYLWSTATGKASNLTAKRSNLLCDEQEAKQIGSARSYTSVQFSPDSQHVALGVSNGLLEIWDFSQKKKLSEIRKHCDRVSALAWRTDNVIACSSRDKTISVLDLRAREQEIVESQRISLHREEICGLTWSDDGEYLASGGNDNKVLIYSARNLTSPCFRITNHSAAVKAIAWSPHRRDVVCTGGGNSDKMIRVWSLTENKEITSIYTGSQICNMAFGPASNPWDVVVSTGFPTNDVAVWDLNKSKKKQVFQGHSNRVVFMSKNAEATKFVTAAGDELMKFWNVFTPCSADYKSHLNVNKLDLR